MGGKYKGDTPPKKFARLELWSLVEKHFGRARFRLGRYLVLAGPEGGDVAVALGMGILPQNIVAVDNQTEAVTATKWKFPDVNVRLGEATEIIRRDKHKFDFIFLDFCAQLTDPNIDVVAHAAIQGLRPDGLIASTFLVGREQDGLGGTRARVLKEKSIIERDIKKYPIEVRADWEETVPYLARYAVLQEELLKRTRPHGLVPSPVSSLFYQSRGAHRAQGLPMCISLARIVKARSDRLTKTMEEVLYKRQSFYFYSQDERDLALLAVELMEQKRDVGLLLGASKGTIAAWKAHATRGTYE